jgi:hypothetical protein
MCGFYREMGIFAHEDPARRVADRIERLEPTGSTGCTARAFRATPSPYHVRSLREEPFAYRGKVLGRELPTETGAAQTAPAGNPDQGWGCGDRAGHAWDQEGPECDGAGLLLQLLGPLHAKVSVPLARGSERLDGQGPDARSGRAPVVSGGVVGRLLRLGDPQADGSRVAGPWW